MPYPQMTFPDIADRYNGQINRSRESRDGERELVKLGSMSAYGR